MSSPAKLPPIKKSPGSVPDTDNENCIKLITINSSSTTTLSTQAMLMAKKNNEKAIVKVTGEIQTILASENAEDDEWNRKSLIQKATAVASKAAADFARALVDYGPPYDDYSHEDYQQMFAEISEPAMKHTRLHWYLNNRYDPNISDPEDLYNFPIHYCSRNCHMLGLRMILRAGGNVDVTNELGMTALMTCVMMKQAPDKRPIQVKMTKYLISKGADINIRDKAGYCVLDYAVMNSDLELVAFILNNGAKVRRDNHTFYGERRNILDLAKDPEIYKILNNLLKKEEKKFNYEQDIKERYRKLSELDKVSEKNHKLLEKKRLQNLVKKAQLEVQKKKDFIAATRRAELDRGMATLDHLNNDKVRDRYGEWRRDEFHKWRYILCKPDLSVKNVFPEGVKSMEKLRDVNNKVSYASLWKELTSGSDIEFKWIKDKPFLLEEEKMENGEINMEDIQSITSVSINSNPLSHL